jgi:hypothetical protein
VGRKNSKTSLGSHGHVGGTRPGQTWKTTKNLSVHDGEERGCGEGVGLYVVYIVNEEGGNGESVGSEASSLMSYTLRYVSVT